MAYGVLQNDSGWTGPGFAVIASPEAAGPPGGGLVIL